MVHDPGLLTFGFEWKHGKSCTYKSDQKKSRIFLIQKHLTSISVCYQHIFLLSESYRFVFSSNMRCFIFLYGAYLEVLIKWRCFTMKISSNHALQILSTKDPFRLFSLDMSKTAGIFRLEFHKSQSESHEGFVYVHENAVFFFVWRLVAAP